MVTRLLAPLEYWTKVLKAAYFLTQQKVTNLAQKRRFGKAII